MTRHCMKVLAAAALLILAGTAGAAAATDGAQLSFVKAQPALCQANLSVAQQAPSNLLGMPAPKLQTCQQECWSFRKSCVAGCNGDDQCLSDCQDQYEYCMCGGCNYCP
jgi:hypothetical protein